MAASDMKALINAARAALRAGISYVTDANVIVLGDLDNPILDELQSFPAIGIKDGDVDESPGFQDGEESFLHLDVAAYVQIMTPEASLMGTDTLKGVLDIEADIKEILNDNTLSQTGFILGVVSKRFASRTLFSDQSMIQMKKIRFKYQKLSDY